MGQRVRNAASQASPSSRNHSLLTRSPGDAGAQTSLRRLATEDRKGVANCAGLPGTKGFPGSGIFSAKTGTMPGTVRLTQSLFLNLQDVCTIQ